MKRFFVLCIALVTAGTIVGCSKGMDEEEGIATFEGFVIDATTQNPIPDAIVRIMPLGVRGITNEDGHFRLEVEIDSTTRVQVEATKSGFTPRSLPAVAQAGQVVSLIGEGAIQLSPSGSAVTPSGKASNILLLNQSAQNIGVKESGSEEVANITFQVTDSLGRPVILSNTTDVRFTLGAHPGGGEFIFPSSARTNNNGEVTVNLSSGKTAGVVQIVAETTVDGRTIRSLPVAVAIHGGLPDQRFFSLGPEKFNFPGLRTHGLTNSISIVVGDKWSNPVKPGTAVYFSTTGGVIAGSALTNEQGRGTVNLISGNPEPERGIAVITARTADDQQEIVSDQTPVVFSGPTRLIIDQTCKAVLNQTCHFEVMDFNRNPLVEGTSISVRAEGTRVKATGHTAVTLGDTELTYNGTSYHVVRGSGITDFFFSIVPDLRIDEEGDPSVSTVTISVTSPNGSVSLVLTPTGVARPGQAGVTMEQVSSGKMAFVAAE